MSMADEELERMVCDYLDGTLGEEETERLRQRLGRDPAALDTMCSQALLASNLQRLANATGQLRNDRREAIWQSQNRRMFRVALSVAAVVALVLGAVFYRIVVPPAVRTAAIEAAPHSAFSRSGGNDGETGDRLRIGETIALSQGTVRLTLPDGTLCLAEAPARLTLRSLGHIDVAGGVTKFRVSKGSEGFRVTTPDLEVVDLGTAFGIDDTVESLPEVHVMDGMVRATARRGRRESAVIRAGNAGAIGAAGTLRPIPQDEARFPSRLPEGLPAVRFSFEPGAGDDYEASGSLARSNGIRVISAEDGCPAPIGIDGRVGSALKFEKRKSRLVTSWPGISGALPRTIAFWIRLDGPSDKSGNILGWGLPSGEERMSQFSLIYSGKGLGALRISSGQRWLQSSSRIDDGAWHHVAVVLDHYSPGSWPSVKLYLDGKVDTLTPRIPEEVNGGAAPLDTFDTIIHHPRSLPLTFGSFGNPSSVNSFQGCLDEVVITPGILDESQVHALLEGRLHDSGLALDDSAATDAK